VAMNKIPQEDIENFSVTMNLQAHRTVERSRDPLIPSREARRATWVNTAGLYCSLDENTSQCETKDFLNQPVTYLIISENPLSIFDVETYCQAKGVLESTFYAGMTSGTLGIHQLHGMKIHGAMWPSQKNREGKSLVLYTENIPGFPKGFTAQ